MKKLLLFVIVSAFIVSCEKEDKDFEVNEDNSTEYVYYLDADASLVNDHSFEDSNKLPLYDEDYPEPDENADDFELPDNNPPEPNCTAQPGENNLYVDIRELCGTCSDSYTREENSITSPWCTIKKAGETAQAGDTVYVKEGVYAGEIIIANSGQQDQKIVFRSFPEETVILARIFHKGI